jgi:hypothetical protein
MMIVMGYMLGMNDGDEGGIAIVWYCMAACGCVYPLPRMFSDFHVADTVSKSSKMVETRMSGL